MTTLDEKSFVSNHEIGMLLMVTYLCLSRVETADEAGIKRYSHSSSSKTHSLENFQTQSTLLRLFDWYFSNFLFYCSMFGANDSWESEFQMPSSTNTKYTFFRETMIIYETKRLSQWYRCIICCLFSSIFVFMVVNAVVWFMTVSVVCLLFVIVVAVVLVTCHWYCW